MTGKELRKLSRAALIQLLIEQMEENAKLEARSKEMEKKLSDRTIALANAGSIADASMSLNHVFEAADQAAAQYLDNIQAAYQRCEALIAGANQKAAIIVQNAQMQAREIVAQAERYASAPDIDKSQQPAGETEKSAQAKPEQNKHTRGKKWGSRDGRKQAAAAAQRQTAKQPSAQPQAAQQPQNPPKPQQQTAPAPSGGDRLKSEQQPVPAPTGGRLKNEQQSAPAPTGGTRLKAEQMQNEADQVPVSEPKEVHMDDLFEDAFSFMWQQNQD
jgi:hypothetical protein